MNLLLDILRFPRLRTELINRIRNFKYEVMDNGELFLPEMKVALGGIFTLEHLRGGELLGKPVTSNVVVNEGLDYILDVALSDGTKLSNWYVAIFGNNVTPGGTLTAATAPGTLGEITGAYDEATRPQWVDAGPTAQNVTNSASKAQFSINTDSTTIYGASLHSDNTKGGTVGKLAAAGRFASSRLAMSGDDVLVTYSLTAQDA